MIKNYLKAVLLLFVTATAAVSQTTTTTATYSSGDLSSDFFTGTVPITANSTCPGTLNVPVPAGRYVTAVQVEYDFEAIGGNWQSEQSSYLECVTTSTKEAAVSIGPAVNGPGIVSYNRSGLNIANGIVPVGGLQFRIHAFRSFTGGGCTTFAQRIRNNTFKITVTHAPAPTCPPPSSLGLNSVTATSATVGWTSGGATNWEVEYGANGFTPGTGTRLAATTNPFTINSLSPSSGYDIVVRDSCGPADVSFWSAPISIRTSCSVVSAPWVEDFEANVWQPGTGFGVIGTIDTCFERNFSNHFTMKAGPPAFAPFNTGPSGDHTTGSGKYAFSERITFGTFPSTARITTPPIDLSPLTTPELTFWYHMFGVDVNRLEVLASTDGLSYTSVYVKTGQQQSAKADPWLEAIVDLSSYANDTVYLRFEVLQNSFGTAGDVAIDDLDVHEAPTCKKPTNLSLVSANFNSITVGWTTGGASNWQVEYGPVGFTPGSGTILSATSNPFTIPGLSSSTQYDIYVRDSCSATDISAWSSVLSASTTCLPVAAPYTENFDGTAWTRGPFINSLGTIDNCWIRDEQVYVFKSGPPLFVSNFTGSTVDHTLGTAAGKYLQAERLAFAPGIDTATIQSVPIDLSPLTVPELTFWYHMFGADINNLRVYVSNNDGATFSQVSVLTGQQQLSNTDAWKEAVVNLSSYANDTIILQFVAVPQNFMINADLCIDDVDIHEQPSCPKPQLLSVVGQTNTSVTLQWTTGGATNWQIEYGAPGFSLGSGTIVNANSNPFTVNSLSASTAYEFYVRDSCGPGDVSAWVGLASATTDCNPVSAPYVENFDGAVWVPGTFTVPGTLDPCWSSDTGLNYQFVPMTTTTGFGTGPSADHTTGSGKFLVTQRFFIGFAQTAVTTAESPLIDLTPLTTPELTFWYHMFGANIDSLQVEVFDGSTWKREASVVGAQQVSKTDAWQQLLVDISAYANDTIKLRFTAYRDSPFAFNSDMAIDDVDIHEQPTCPQPSNIAVTASTGNSITLSWTTGGASNWQIEYGPSGFASGSGTIINATSNPFTVTNLNSSTSYDFYVRDSCSATDLSLWAGPATGSTSCLPLAAPFLETFDGSPWVIGTNFNDTGSLAPCWTRNPLTNYFWKPGPPLFPNNFTGPSGDHTTGSGKYLFAESFFGGGTPPFDAILETPPIDLSALTVPELSFWYHMFGTGIGSMSVEIDAGSGFSQIWSLTGQQQTSGTDAWKEAVVSLSTYANDTVVIRFKASKSSFSTLADAAIDDLDIHEAPSCPKPQTLSIVGKTNSTVTLQWTTGGATNWQIEYGSPGFTPGSGTIINVGSNPFTVPGLSANTGYDFYVRDSCGVADVSDWTGPVGETTDCNPIPAPYLETFDGSSFVNSSFGNAGSIDACWSRDESVNFQWGPNTTTTTFNTGPTSDHTSGTGKFLFTHRLFGALGASQIATASSPLIDLSPLTTPEMTFWYHTFGADIDSIGVEVFDGSSWTHVFTVVGQQQSSKTDAWKEAVVNLSGFANDTIKVRFKGHRNGVFAFNSSMAIDDLDIHEQPTCPKPTGVTVTAATANSITVSWTTGGATNWQIEYGTSGFTPGTGAGTIINATTNPFTVTTLNSSTTYDFYVRDSCGVADVSDWAGPGTGATDCLPVLAPFSENFDGPSWTSGPNFNDTGTVGACWVRTPLTNYFWRVGPPPFVSNFTGPAADHTTGSGKFIFAESVFGGGTAPFDAFMETPPIDLSPLTTPELRFWYHMFGNGIGSLAVEVDNGNGYSQVWSRTGQQQTSGTAAWQEAIVSLSSYSNDTIKIRFKATKATFTTLADAAVDDILVDDAPNCPRPLAVTATGSTQTSVTLSWTTGGATNWLIGYRTTGSTGPLTIVAAPTNPFTITSLAPSTSYDFYVKDSCGTADVSLWEGPLPASTACGVPTAPWSENFNGGGWVSGTGFDNSGNQINSCWSRPSSNNPNFGTRSGTTTSPGTGPSGGVGGVGNYIYTEASGGASGAGEITSPWIYIPNSLLNPRFKFAYHMFGAGITSLAVQIDNGSGFGANVLTKTGAQHISNVDPWKVDSIMLNIYKGDTVRFKFIGTNSGFNGDIAVDEVEVKADPNSPNCGDPTNLNITAVTPTGFTVNWVGIGTSQVEVVLAGQPQGSGATYPGAVSPLVVNGLLANTAYDIYVRDSCNTNLFSQWVDTNQTTLPCPAITPSFTHTSVWLATSFNSITTVNADSIYWSFGDGNNSSTANPLHNYGAPGVYVVTMDAFSDCGSTGTMFDTIRVCDTLQADFSFNQVGDTVFFDASASSNATSYSWDFNGTGGSGMMTSYKFPTPGTKPVVLTVYNDCGDSVSVTKNVSVCLAPVASWTYNIISTTSAGMLVQFDGSASQNATSYEWDFGDGSALVTGQVMPQHLYITPSLQYKVTLKVTNTCNDVNISSFRLNQISLNELDIENLQIDLYPNPASSMVNLKWDHSEVRPEKLELIDAAGRLILQHQIPMDAQGDYQFDVSKLSQGYYMLRLSTDMGVKEFKLLRD